MARWQIKTARYVYIKENLWIHIRPFRKSDFSHSKSVSGILCHHLINENFCFLISTSKIWKFCFSKFLQGNKCLVVSTTLSWKSLWNFTVEGKVGKEKLSSKGLYASTFLFSGRYYFPKLSYVRKEKYTF